MSECPESHDDEHHFPVNVKTGQERPDCIYCGRTKKEIIGGNLRDFLGGSRSNRPPRPIRPKPKIESEEIIDID